MADNPNPGGSEPQVETGEDQRTIHADWLDVDGHPWHIVASQNRLTLRDGENEVSLPRESWSRDLYIAEHGTRTIVRIETFEISVRFMVDSAQAETIVAVVAPAEVNTNEEPSKASTDSTESSPRDLMWPKVSPLAIWALACSPLAFIPGWGLVFAAITGVLLSLHRAKVRRAGAWHHSRTICKVAAIVMIAGLVTSALAIWCAGSPPAGIIVTIGVGVPAEPTGRNWGVIVAALLVVLISLSVHEAAHAISAWWLGDDLAKSQGRVTLNPLSHIDPFGTILLPLFMVWVGGPIFGYAKPVPVRVESLPKWRRAHILISLAGPGSNLLLAAGSMLLLLAVASTLRLAVPDAVTSNLSSSAIGSPVMASGFVLAPVFAAVCTILRLSIFVNLFLAFFNLVPIPPLDGSWVLEHSFPRTMGPIYATIRPYGFLLFLGAIHYNLFQYLAFPIFFVFAQWRSLLFEVTGLG